MNNRIKVSPKKNYTSSHTIWSSNQFFRDNKEVVFEHDEYGITFRVPSIEDEHSRRNVYPNGLAGFTLSVYDVDLKQGTFYLDVEESDCDRVVFNY
jgi:hypothetical protein